MIGSLLLMCMSLHLVEVMAAGMGREGCGDSKGCLFKPAGCDPARDCSIAVIFFVDGPNSLKVQLTAQALEPQPPAQYIAIGFSNDEHMGDDMVSECVLSTDPQGAVNTKVFLSYNAPVSKANQRVSLTDEEKATLFHNVTGQVADGRVSCEFSQQIVPQIGDHDDHLRTLNKKYFIMGATGSGKPQELTALHNVRKSFHVPIISTRALNPALTGVQEYDLPAAFNPNVADLNDEDDSEIDHRSTSPTVTFSIAAILLTLLAHLL